MHRASGITRWVGRAALIVLSAALVSCSGMGDRSEAQRDWPTDLGDFEQELAAERADIERDRARQADSQNAYTSQQGNTTPDGEERVGIVLTRPLSNTGGARSRSLPEGTADDGAATDAPYGSSDLKYRDLGVSLGTMYRHGFTERPWLRGGVHIGTHRYLPHHLRRGIQPHPLYSIGRGYGRVFPGRTRGPAVHYDYYGENDLRRWYYGYGEHDVARWYFGHDPYYHDYLPPSQRYPLPRYRLRDSLLDQRLELQRRHYRDRLDDARRRDRADRLRPYKPRRLDRLDAATRSRLNRNNRTLERRVVPRHDQLHRSPEPVGPQQPSWRTGSDNGQR